MLSIESTPSKRRQLDNSETRIYTTNKKPERPQRNRRKSRHSLQKSRELHASNTDNKRKSKEPRRRYRSASRLKHNIEKLNEKIEASQLKGILRQHQKYVQSIKQAHQLEMRELKDTWKGVIKNYERRCKKLLQKWSKKQKRQHQYFAEYISKMPIKFCSKQLLKLKEIKTRLIKKEQYDQLQLIENEIKQAEQQMIQKVGGQFKTKCDNLRKQIETKNHKEFNVLVSKITKGKQEQQMLYLKQKERLEQKYKNVTMQIKIQHNRELNEQKRKASRRPKTISFKDK